VTGWSPDCVTLLPISGGHACGDVMPPASQHTKWAVLPCPSSIIAESRWSPPARSRHIAAISLVSTTRQEPGRGAWWQVGASGTMEVPHGRETRRQPPVVRNPFMPLPDSTRPLVRDDFAFHGFDNQAAPLDRILGVIGIRSGAPSLTVVEDAVFVPAFRVPAADPSHGRFAVEGGIVTSDGRSLDEAQVRRRGTRWGIRVLGGVSNPGEVEPARVIDAEVVYLGWFFHQFGHFLLESLARTWVLGEIDPATKVVFHALRGNTPEGTRREILEAFGVPIDRILVLDQPTRLRRIIVPEPLFEISTSAHERMAVPFQRVAARLVGDERQSEQPVYLSRRLLPGNLRQIVGEGEMEEVLRENGFLVVHPETMTFEEQLGVLNRHAHIFAAVGSAAHAVLFARANPGLHLLTDAIPREDYFLAPKAAGAHTTYINCLGRGDRPFIDNRSPVLPEMGTLVGYLDVRGFLRRRLRAAIATRATRTLSARAGYDEAWYYAAVLDVLPHGETLPSEIERDALTEARSSWPLSWILARHFMVQDATRVDQLALQFAHLVEAESDLARLARYHGDVESMAPRVMKACGPETVDRVANALARVFGMPAKPRTRVRAATPNR
jgi:hypothetical protein